MIAPIANGGIVAEERRTIHERIAVLELERKELGQKIHEIKTLKQEDWRDQYRLSQERLAAVKEDIARLKARLNELNTLDDLTSKQPVTYTTEYRKYINDEYRAVTNRIGQLKVRLRDVIPVLEEAALTTTASPIDRADLLAQLQIERQSIRDDLIKLRLQAKDLEEIRRRFLVRSKARDNTSVAIDEAYKELRDFMAFLPIDDAQHAGLQQRVSQVLLCMRNSLEQEHTDKLKEIERSLIAKYETEAQEKDVIIRHLRSSLLKAEQTAKEHEFRRAHLRSFIRSVWASRVPATTDDKARGYQHRVMVDGKLAQEWEDI